MVGIFPYLQKKYIKHKFSINLLLIYSVGWFLLTYSLSMSSDAADHWVWSRKLFPSYLEHPPMIAIYLRMFDTLFPSPVFALKIASILTSSLTYFFLYLGAFHFKRSGKISKGYLLCLFSSPYLIILGAHISITPLMTLFCAIAFFLMARFYRTQNPNYLLGMGLALGFAMLSKYLAIFYFVAFYGWILFEPSMRRYLKSWQLYMFPLLSVLVFTPVLYANFTQNFRFLFFQLNRGFGETFAWDWGDLGEFWFSFLIYGVLQIPLLGLILLTRKFWGEFRRKEFLFWFWIFSIFPSLLLYSYTILKGGFFDPQWLNLNFFAGLFLIACFCERYFLAKTIKRLLTISLVLSLLFSGIVLLHLKYRILGEFIPSVEDESMDFVAWDESGKQLERIFKEKDAIPEVVFVREYSFGGLISLYMPSHPYPYSLEKSQRNFWISPEDFKTKKIGFVCIPDKCSEYFPQIAKITGKKLEYLGQAETFHPFTHEKIRTLIAYSFR